jgi:hypothetical protein
MSITQETPTPIPEKVLPRENTIEYRGNPLPVIIDLDILREAGFPIDSRLIIKESKSVSKSPKLLKKTGYYIVPELGFFYYHKIDPLVRKNNYLFEINPPTKIKKEGFVVIEKELYYVTLGDLDRRVVRTSRLVKTKKTNLTYDDFVNNTFSPASAKRVDLTKENSISEGRASGTEESVSDFQIGLPTGTQNEELRGVGESFNMDELKAIELAFLQQEQALLHSISEEEGLDYEIEEAA